MRMHGLVAVLAWAATSASAGPIDKEPAAMAMKDELARTMAKLEAPGASKPYFVSYALWDERLVSAEASLGALISTSDTPRRFIDIDLRVGGYDFDNSNVAQSFDNRQSVTIALDEDYAAIRHDLWAATDAAYKNAIEMLERKQAVAKAENKGADDADSFSKEPPSQIVHEPAAKTLESARLEALAKKLSAVFRQNEDVYRSSVWVTEGSGKRYFLSSEGSMSVQAETGTVVHVTCETQAADGMQLRDSRRFAANRFEDLPAESEMIAQVEKMSRDLSALRKAPIVDDYDGPVLFTGIAAGQVIRALLAENLAGTPAPKGDRPGMRGYGESELVGKIGQRILPAGVSVIDDPTLTKLGKLPLLGGYEFDEEGVPAAKVSLIENGTLRRFLMSRTPRKGFEHSNGHGRSTPLAPVRAHPANLILSSSAKVQDKALLKKALQAAKAAGLDYVLVADRLADSIEREDFDPAAFANGGAFVPHPTSLKRVYADGHEEIVRGGTFAGIQLRSLKDLLAVGTAVTPYHYSASGLGARFDMLVPSPNGFYVSIASPALLFHDIDVRKPTGPQKKPPIAPRPQPTK